MLIVFTDGACSNNGKKNARASFAVVWPHHEEHNTGERLMANEAQTNNRGEYRALIHAIIQADLIDPLREKTLIAYTDSLLLVKSMDEWMPKWKKNNWRKADGQIVSNLDLLEVLDKLRARRNLVLKHVRAHTGKKDWASIYNDKVDRLARDALLDPRFSPVQNHI